MKYVEFLKYSNIIILGFIIWLFLAPRTGKPNYGESFLAYMTALLFCLIGTSEIMLTKPVAFFFTVGGVMAFFFNLVRLTTRFTVRHK